MSILENIGAKFSGNEGGARLYGLGLLASQLGSGQTPNAGPALQMLEERKSQNALRAQMQDGEFLNQFSPQEQAFLSTLPPAAAQQLIAQRIFAAPAAPVSGTEINGQLINPQTGEVMGDFRDPETPEGTYQPLSDEEAAALDLEPGIYQRAPNGKIEPISGAGDPIQYMQSGAQLGEGFDPDTMYQVTSGPGVFTASPISGGPAVVVENNAAAQESAFSAETGKILATEAAAIVDAGSAAQRSMGQLQTLDAALAASPEGLAASLTNVASGLGIKLEGASDIELANAIISQMVPAQRPPGSGPMSDADLALFKQSLPRLINSREGNEKIVSTMRAILEYDVARAGIARQQQTGAITAQEAFAAYNNLGNPLADFATAGAAPAGDGATGTLSNDDLMTKYGN